MTLSGAVALPAHAATPTVRLAAPVASWHVASTQPDGTNSSVHLAADVTGLTAAELAVVSVRFAAKPTSGVRANLAVDSSAPFSTEWSPAPGTYDITAEVLDNAGTVTATTTTTGVTVSASASSVHIGSTPQGGLLGWYRASGAATGYVSVGGTRSVNGPRVDVSLGTSWNASAVGTAPAAPGSQSWAVAAPVNPASPPTGDTAGTTIATWVTAAAVDAGGTASDEAIPVSLYLQRIAAATAPASINGAKNADLAVPVVVTDEFRRPIVGLPVTGTATGGATVVTGATTDQTGTATLTVRSSVAGSSTLTFATRYGAAFDPTVDSQLTTALSTYTAIPSSLVLASSPATSVLPPASYNTAVVTATVRDQYGSLLAGTAVNAKETVTRTSGGSVTTKTWASGTGLASTTDAQGRITLAHDPSINAAGTDVYDLYLEQDGVAGRSNGDLGASRLTLQWATSSLLFDPCTAVACGSQQQVGNIATYTVREGLGATPSAGRALALTITGGTGAGFPTGQPGTTLRTSATTATCTTDSAGACTFTLLDNVAETAVVRATDTGPAPASGATAATLTISVRSKSVALNNIVSLGTSVIDPLGALTGSAARPGGALVYRATVRDVANLPIANAHVAVTVNHGFVTRNTLDGSLSFNKLVFNPAPVNGAAVTLPQSLGTTVDVVTDSAGVATITVALGRDAALDATGVVTVAASFAANGSVATMPSIGTFTTDAALLPATPAGVRDPLNGDPAQPLVLTDATAGQVLNGFASLTLTRSVLMWVRDAYGNLARPSAALSLTAAGVGSLATTARVASYTGDKRPVVLSPTVVGNTTLTASIALPVTTFTVSGATIGVTTRSATQVTTAGPLQWYVPNVTVAAGATYVVTRSPRATYYALGTAVTFRLLAKDQHQQPIKGVSVVIDRVGPGNASPGHFSLVTDATGAIAYTVTGAVAGNLSVLFVVSSGGTQLFRSLTGIGFIAVPTITAPASRTGAGTVAITGRTRGGASVSLQRRLYGAVAFLPIASTKATAAGAYAFAPQVTRTAVYRVVVNGAVVSATVSVRMRVKATLTLTSSGGKLTARIASTSPVVRSALVTFYRVFSNGTRHVIGTATTDSLGHATATFTYASGSTITVVAAVHDVSGVTGNWTTAVAKRV